MNEIIALRHLVAQHVEDVERWKSAFAGRIKELQELVASGEWSTGNSITDYFLLYWGTIDEEIARPLHELEEQMVGMKGQLFLVVHKEARERHVYGGVSREDDYYRKVIYFMGILKGEEFVFCAGLYGLPTEKYLQVGMGKACENGPFLFPVIKGLHAPNTIEIGARVETVFDVVVGDADVLGYRLGGGTWANMLKSSLFEEHYPSNGVWTDMLKSAARALGKDIPE
ncbi:MAG: hypothetical protein ACYC48_02760 [Minisyncoccota bacterium]